MDLLRGTDGGRRSATRLNSYLKLPEGHWVGRALGRSVVICSSRFVSVQAGTVCFRSLSLRLGSTRLPMGNNGNRRIRTGTDGSCLNGYEQIESDTNGSAPWHRRRSSWNGAIAIFSLHCRQATGFPFVSVLGRRCVFPLQRILTRRHARSFLRQVPATTGRSSRSVRCTACAARRVASAGQIIAPAHSPRRHGVRRTDVAVGARQSRGTTGTSPRASPSVSVRQRRRARTLPRPARRE